MQLSEDEMCKDQEESISLMRANVNMIAFNQTQDYIAVATERGIELIKNDGASKDV